MGCVVCLCDMNPQCLLLQTSTHLTWTQGWQRTTCPGQFSIVFPQDRFHGCCEWRDNQRLVHDKTSLPIPTQYVPHIYCEFRSLTLKFYSHTFQQSSGQFGGLSLKCIYFKATRSTWFFQEDQPLNRAQKKNRCSLIDVRDVHLIFTGINAKSPLLILVGYNSCETRNLL